MSLQPQNTTIRSGERSAGLRPGQRFGRRSSLWLCLLAALLACGVFAGFTESALGDDLEDFRVIVHPSNPIDAATRSYLTEIFLKRTTRWTDGEMIHPVDQIASSETRQQFSRRVLKRSVTAVRNYWQQKIFSGRDLPPPELASDQAVVKYVLSRPGAVGYVSSDAALGQAKVLVIR